MPTQTYQVIRDRLFNRLKQTSGKKVAYNHRLKTHLGDNDAGVAAYMAVLNNTAGFKEDGLSLAPGIVNRNSYVEDLLAAIYDNYKARGWTIYYA